MLMRHPRTALPAGLAAAFRAPPYFIGRASEGPVSTLRVWRVSCIGWEAVRQRLSLQPSLPRQCTQGGRKRTPIVPCMNLVGLGVHPAKPHVSTGRVQLDVVHLARVGDFCVRGRGVLPICARPLSAAGVDARGRAGTCIREGTRAVALTCVWARASGHASPPVSCVSSGRG